MKFSITHYMQMHLQALLSSLGSILRSPIPSLLTIVVLGVAIALPSGLFVLTQNIFSVSETWMSGNQISVFLKEEVTDKNAQGLILKLQKHEDIGSIEYLPPEGAYEEFRNNSGFGEALDALDENPLPAVLTIYPKNTVLSPEKSEHLLHYISKQDEVDIAQLDLEWVQRLYLMLQLVYRLILILAVLFGATVLLIVGNTLRLTIQNQSETIYVNKLIGATDAFVRRPFLYAGAWFGFFGALVCWIIISQTLHLLSGPLELLAVLYQSKFRLASLSPMEIFALLAIGASLGWTGAWLALAKHIKAIEPS